MTKFGSFTDFSLERVKIYPNSGGDPVDVTTLINVFHYVESVTAPFLSGTMEVVDSGGLLQGLPIQGAEKVEIEVKTNSSEELTKYTLVIWRVSNRFVQNQKQAYALGLISVEALTNEVTRIQERLEGNPKDIVQKLLTDKIKTDKPFNKENSLFKVKLLPNNKRPFDLISSLAVKSISPKAKVEQQGSSNNGEASEAESVKGSSGFFFWENKRGYNFYSVDSLCADDSSDLKNKDLDLPPWGPYIEKLGNQDDGADDRFVIYQSLFDSEVDLLTSLRKGKYSSFITFFNHSTGQYEEFQYKIQQSYDSMAHLGGQESITKVPANDVELSEKPSKRISMILDHETWYNDPGIASPDPDDGSDSPTEFADWQMHFAAQSIARYQLLKNQQCTLVIPGNPEICAGDKIDISLLSKLPNKEQKTEQFDPETSGIYLIEEVTHTYDTTIGTNGRFLTTLRLMRDSYGKKDKQSKHGTK